MAEVAIPRSLIAEILQLIGVSIKVISALPTRAVPMLLAFGAWGRSQQAVTLLKSSFRRNLRQESRSSGEYRLRSRIAQLN